MSKETLSTSEETKKETPKHVNALEEKYKEETKQEPHATRLDPDNIKEIFSSASLILSNNLSISSKCCGCSPIPTGWFR